MPSGWRTRRPPSARSVRRYRSRCRETRPHVPRAQQEAYVAWFDAIQASTASVREHGAGIPFHEAGRAHEVVLGSQATGRTHATGSREPRGVGRLAPPPPPPAPPTGLRPPPPADLITDETSDRGPGRT